LRTLWGPSAQTRPHHSSRRGLFGDTREYRNAPSTPLWRFAASLGLPRCPHVQLLLVQHAQAHNLSCLLKLALDALLDRRQAKLLQALLGPSSTLDRATSRRTHPQRLWPSTSRPSATMLALPSITAQRLHTCSQCVLHRHRRADLLPTLAGARPSNLRRRSHPSHHHHAKCDLNSPPVWSQGLNL